MPSRWSRWPGWNGRSSKPKGLPRSPKHSPVLTTLKYGIIKVRKGGNEELFTVAGGVAEVQPDIVTILADAAENVKEIDVTRAEEARKRAEEVLAKGVPADTDAYLAMEAALRRSNLRLDAARRYRRGGTRMPGSES